MTYVELATTFGKMKERMGAFARRTRTLRRRLAVILAVVGPGIITSNVDNDAGGITTYTLAGAQFGYKLLWVLIPLTIALYVSEEMCARMGVVTGKGLSDLIREEFGFRSTYMRLSEAMRRTGGAARATGGAVRSGAPGRRHRDPPDGRRRAPGDGRLGSWADGPVHAHRTDRRRRCRGRVRRRLAGRDDLLQHLGGSGSRPGGAVPAGDDGPVRGARAVYRPALDRVQQGRKYLLAGTLLARGLLCWGMSAAINSPVTLLPAAFGILVLQKAYGVARASVTPRLLPAEITLVTANARSQLITADRLHARRRAGSRHPGHGRVRLGAAGGHGDLPRRHDSSRSGCPTRWTRRRRPPPPRQAATPPRRRRRPGSGRRRPAARFLPERAWAIRPGRPAPTGGSANGRMGSRDGRTRPYEPAAATAGRRRDACPPGRPDPEAAARRAGPATGRAAGGGAWPTSGPVVGEAMRANAVLRAFSGYMVFFLAFFLRSEHFGVSHNVALGALVAAAAAGGLAAMAIGSLIRVAGSAVHPVRHAHPGADRDRGRAPGSSAWRRRSRWRSPPRSPPGWPSWRWTPPCSARSARRSGRRRSRSPRR